MTETDQNAVNLTHETSQARSWLTKRRVLAIITAFLAILLSLPLITGYLTEKRIKQIIRKIPPTWGLSLKLDKYHRGWFHSKAEIRVELIEPTAKAAYRHYSLLAGEEAAASSKAKSFQFKIISNISHGPFILEHRELGQWRVELGRALMNSSLVIPESQRVVMAQLLDQSTLFNGTTLIRLDGTTETHLRSAYLNFHDPESHIKMAATGLKINWRMSRNLSRLQGHSKFGEVTLAGPGIAVNLSNVQFDSDYALANYGLWFGDSKLTFPFTTFTVDGKDRIIMRDFMLSSKNSILGNVVNYEMESHLDKVIVREVSYGPGTLRAVLKNIDARALSDLNQLTKRYSLLFSNDMMSTAEFRKQISSVFPRLFGYGLQAQLNPVVLATPSGEVSVQAWLTLPNQHRQRPTDLQGLFDKADASFVVALPKPLVHGVVETFLMAQNHYLQAITQHHAHGASGHTHHGQSLVPVAQIPALANQRINEWLGASYLTESGDRFVLSLVYKNENVYLNGHAMKELPTIGQS